jgi:pyridoxine kinase
MQNLYTLAINSFAVHGTASLKTIIRVLGSRVLPVPSLLLNGLTNMPIVRKVDLPFRDLLQSTLDLVVHRNQRVILYIGYLGKAEHADDILDMVQQYRSHIHLILTDPISGDHGRAYVPPEIIHRWPDLIRHSDFVFPNLTEIKLLCGHEPNGTETPKFYVSRFQELFPKVQLVVTSLQLDDHGIGVQWHGGDKPFTYSHPVLTKNYGGSGDTFLALFILFHFYRQMSMEESLKAAADQTYHIIGHSIRQGAEELILDDLEVSSPVTLL